MPHINLNTRASIDTAVRVALVPYLEGTIGTSSSDTSLAPPTAFSSIKDANLTSPELVPVPYANFTASSLEQTEIPLAVVSLRASALDKIQNFLLRGERRQAYHYALDERLWAHAMVIASSIDKEAWKEVVNEFLRTELGVKEDPTRRNNVVPNGPAPLSNGREGLKVAYSLFSGQGAAAGK